MERFIKNFIVNSEESLTRMIQQHIQGRVVEIRKQVHPYNTIGKIQAMVVYEVEKDKP